VEVPTGRKGEMDTERRKVGRVENKGWKREKCGCYLNFPIATKKKATQEMTA